MPHNGVEGFRRPEENRVYSNAVFNMLEVPSDMINDVASRFCHHGW